MFVFGLVTLYTLSNFLLKVFSPCDCKLPILDLSHGGY